MAEYAYDANWQSERERLAGLEALFDPGTIQVLTGLGVGDGWRCLEIGAGGGSIAEWLSHTVAPRGSVVATDLDTRFVERVDADNLEVRQHNILTDELEESAFDLAHSRMLVEHLPDREIVLKRIVSALKPGGLAVIEDVDFSEVLHLPATKFFGHPPSLGRLLNKAGRAILKLMSSMGFDPTYGRRLPRDLELVGLTDVGAETRGRLVRGGTKETTFFRLSLLALKPRLIEAGLLSERDAERTLTALDDPSLSYVVPMIVSAWGRRPG